MIGYYRKTLVELFTKVQRLQADPQGNLALCLDIQETLVRKVTYVENRVRLLRRGIRQAAGSLRTKRADPMPKSTATEHKDRIHRYREQVEQYHTLLSVFRSVGDAVAFTYLDKWDIKPMAFRQGPGFLSGKSGLRFERRILREAFRCGRAAILNDLTTSLRYGDITLPSQDTVEFVEAKTSSFGGSRARRQTEAIEKICGYLRDDLVTGLYRPGWEMRRTDMHAPETNHRCELNRLIGDAYRGSRNYAEVEEGLLYFVEVERRGVRTGSIIHLLERVMAGRGRNQICFLLNSMKHGMLAYYPYPLAIADPQAAFDFYAGNLLILVLLDADVMAKQLASHNLVLEFTEDADCALVIRSLDPRWREEDWAAISRHFFGRVPCEFLSLDWFVKEVIHRAVSITTELGDLRAGGALTSDPPMKRPESRALADHGHG